MEQLNDTQVSSGESWGKVRRMEKERRHVLKLCLYETLVLAVGGCFKLPSYSKAALKRSFVSHFKNSKINSFTMFEDWKRLSYLKAAAFCSS